MIYDYANGLKAIEISFIRCITPFFDLKSIISSFHSELKKPSILSGKSSRSQF
jgi:hypothetical protein